MILVSNLPLLLLLGLRFLCQGGREREKRKSNRSKRREREGRRGGEGGRRGGKANITTTTKNDKEEARENGMINNINIETKRVISRNERIWQRWKPSPTFTPANADEFNNSNKQTKKIHRKNFNTMNQKKRRKRRGRGRRRRRRRRCWRRRMLIVNICYQSI